MSIPSLSKLDSIPTSPRGAEPTTPSGSRTLPISLATPTSYSPASLGSRFPTTIPSKNPIALRLYKVLGANYQDASTREALETLSSFYAPSAVESSRSTDATQNGKKPSTSLNGEEEEEEEEVWGTEYVKARRKDAAENLQTRLEVDGEAALRARKNLRRDIEMKLADSSRKFLAAFAEVDQVERPHIYQLSYIDRQTAYYSFRIETRCSPNTHHRHASSV